MLTELFRERARREAVQKAALVNGLPLSKGKKLPPGTIRAWGNQRWKKIADGKWEQVKKEGHLPAGAEIGAMKKKPSEDYKRKRAAWDAYEESVQASRARSAEGEKPKGEKYDPDTGAYYGGEEEGETLVEQRKKPGYVAGTKYAEKPKGYAAVRSEAEPKEEEARKKFRSLPAKEREGMGERPKGEGKTELAPEESAQEWEDWEKKNPNTAWGKMGVSGELRKRDKKRAEEQKGK